MSGERGASKRSLIGTPLDSGSAVLDDFSCRVSSVQLPRRGRIIEIGRRDGCSCVWCGRLLDLESAEATLDHVIPRVKGGPAWLENEVIACRRCNHSRGHVSPADWTRACLQRGQDPALEVVRASLHALEAAIKTRGGLRKARAYLEGQIKRFARWFS